MLFDKKRKNGNNYSINSIQVKCSYSFFIDPELLKNNRYEMTYLKNKFECLFGIKIIETFVTYLSISEKQKKCARKNDTKFPFYGDCKI